MQINWTELSMTTGIEVEVLLARYGQAPVTCQTAATIAKELEVGFSSVLTFG
jgi:hypothetical protein